MAISRPWSRSSTSRRPTAPWWSWTRPTPPASTDRPARGAAPIIPLVVGAAAEALALQEGLAAAGFDARAIRPPPVPEGTARLRVTVRHPVGDGDLLRFAREVARLRPAAGVAVSSV